MGDHTLGDSEASVVLIDKLKAGWPGLRKKVTNVLNTFNRGLNQLEYVPDMHIRMSLANTWYKSYITIKFPEADLEITTYTRNVLKLQWRKWLKNQPTLEYIQARQRGNSGWRDKTSSN